MYLHGAILLILRVRSKAPKVQRTTRTPRWHGKKRLRLSSCIHWARVVCVTNDCSERNVIAGPPDCAGEAVDAVLVCTEVKILDARGFLILPTSECPDIWTRLPRHKWPSSWSNIEDPVIPLQRDLYGHPLADLLWERQFEEVLLGLGLGQSTKLFLSVHADDIKRSRKWLPEEMVKTRLILTRPLHFLITYIWDALNVNTNRMKSLLTNMQKMFESRISAGATEKLPCHAKNCRVVIRYGRSCEKVSLKYIVNWPKKQGSCTKSQLLLGTTIISRRRNCQKYAHRLFWNACTWHELVDPTFFGH